jgi:endonuclease I
VLVLGRKPHGMAIEWKPLRATVTWESDDPRNSWERNSNKEINCLRANPYILIKESNPLPIRNGK